MCGGDDDMNIWEGIPRSRSMYGKLVWLWGAGELELTLRVKIGKFKREGIGKRMDYEDAVNWKVLTKRTRENLEKLSEMFQITWEDVYFFVVKQFVPGLNRAYTRNAISIVVVGIDDRDNHWVFERRETGHASAGKTLIRFEGGTPVQVSEVFAGRVVADWKKFHESGKLWRRGEEGEERNNS